MPAAGLALVLVCASAAHLPAEAAPTIRLTVAVLLRGRDGNPSPVDFSSDVVPLASGDRIRIVVSPHSDCVFYLYLFDAQRRLFLLFPEDPSSGDGLAGTGGSVVLPSSDSWYRLDESRGTEVLYLILSDRRLRDLESKTRTNGQGQVRGETVRRVIRQADVLDEIRRLIADSSRLGGATERPVPVAGDIRGLEEVSEHGGLLIEASGLHVRTIRLDH